MGEGSLKDMDGGPNNAGSKVSDFNRSGSWRRRQGGLFDIKDKGEPRKKILHLPYAKEGAAMWIFSLVGGY
ncbi:beta-galactosidase/beta-glucuronidase [Sesbania bispinosa]|nr:beta-galactosidase/beta-glucuronidase [Sesbania bispinosa]